MLYIMQTEKNAYTSIGLYTKRTNYLGCIIVQYLLYKEIRTHIKLSFSLKLYLMTWYLILYNFLFDFVELITVNNCNLSTSTTNLLWFVGTRYYIFLWKWTFWFMIVKFNSVTGRFCKQSWCKMLEPCLYKNESISGTSIPKTNLPVIFHII